MRKHRSFQCEEGLSRWSSPQRRADTEPSPVWERVEKGPISYNDFKKKYLKISAQLFFAARLTLRLSSAMRQFATLLG